MCCLVRVPFHMLYLRLSKVLESMNRALNDICDRDLGSSGATKSARHHFWVCFKNHVPNAHVPCKRGCHVHCFSLCLQWSQRQSRCWLNAATTDPSWSRMKTPIPTVWRFEKTVASVLTLYHGRDGGTQRASVWSLNCGRARWTSWKSSSMERAL